MRTPQNSFLTLLGHEFFSFECRKAEIAYLREFGDFVTLKNSRRPVAHSTVVDNCIGDFTCTGYQLCDRFEASDNAVRHKRIFKQHQLVGMYYPSALGHPEYAFVRESSECYRFVLPQCTAKMSALIKLRLWRSVFVPSMIEAGYVILHASAYLLDGVGYLVIGDSGSGKTTALLEAVKRGAHIVSNDICLVNEDLDVIGVPGHFMLSSDQIRRYTPFFPKHLGNQSSKVPIRPLELCRAMGTRLAGKIRVANLQVLHPRAPNYCQSTKIADVLTRNAGICAYDVTQFQKILLCNHSVRVSDRVFRALLKRTADHPEQELFPKVGDGLK